MSAAISFNVNPGIAQGEPRCEITGLERDVMCKCMTCQAYRVECKMVDTGKTLYCIAYTFWSIKRQQWISQMEYTHAFSIEEARLAFYQSETEKTFRRVNLVGIAPVVGYLVNDNHGDDLSL